MGGIIFGAAVILFEKKTNILAILGIALGFAGLAMHYIYLPTDDMFRYVAYMNSIQYVNGISEYGLNGQTWPLSAVLLGNNVNTWEWFLDSPARGRSYPESLIKKNKRGPGNHRPDLVCFL